MLTWLPPVPYRILTCFSFPDPGDAPSSEQEVHLQLPLQRSSLLPQPFRPLTASLSLSKPHKSKIWCSTFYWGWTKEGFWSSLSWERCHPKPSKPVPGVPTGQYRFLYHKRCTGAPGSLKRPSTSPWNLSLGWIEDSENFSRRGHVLHALWSPFLALPEPQPLIRWWGRLVLWLPVPLTPRNQWS